MRFTLYWHNTATNLSVLVDMVLFIRQVCRINAPFLMANMRYMNVLWQIKHSIEYHITKPVTVQWFFTSFPRKSNCQGRILSILPSQWAQPAVKLALKNTIFAINAVLAFQSIHFHSLWPKLSEFFSKKYLKRSRVHVQIPVKGVIPQKNSP